MTPLQKDPEQLRTIKEKIDFKSISNEAYYYCPTCFRRYTVDEAYDYDFKCPRDDAYLVQSDQYREVEALMNIIKKLKDGFKM